MDQGIQSIEDLLEGAAGADLDEDSVQGKFQKKQQEIKLKEIEKEAELEADANGIPYMNLFGFPISPEALALIPEEKARQLSVVCFFYDGSSLRFGAVDPFGKELKDYTAQLAKKLYGDYKVYKISEHSLAYTLKMYKALPKPQKINRNIEITEAELNKFSEKFSSFGDLQALIDQAQITDIITMALAASVKSGSSDIHIEAEEGKIKLRFRIDGVLHDVAHINKELWKKIISRLKILAKVKINVSDKPQDGRMTIATKAEKIDIRVSFLPTNYGESVVMRLLRSSSVGLEFGDLGIRDRAFARLKKEVERPNGMIITTGPTGSGKTTTLYAVLKKLNNQETKIITIEDPIEYQLEGVNQSQTTERYTFAQGLRSIVRQDPDVIMVGEIRDLETAEIAIQAALTGHLVLSTIHTNDAAGTVPRFLSMGVKPFLLAPALNAMIGQRLVRKICESCKEEIKLDEETSAKVLSILNKLSDEEKKAIDFKNLKFFAGKGCETCQGIGFKGRIGIYEIMAMNGEIEKLILGGQVSEYDMRDISTKNGMVTMVQDGLLKALDGITSVEEVFRVAEEKGS